MLQVSRRRRYQRAARRCDPSSDVQAEHAGGRDEGRGDGWAGEGKASRGEER